MKVAMPLLAAAALLGACATQEEPKTAAPAPAPQAQSTPSTAPVTPGGPSGTPRSATVAAPGLRSVHFDFDKSDVKDEFRPVLEDHARYLRANPAIKLRVEGNADERGSREYNVALGQRRAEAITRALRILGVDSQRMEAVSFGEEKPRCTQHEESCWAQNRRGDIAY